jgi:hypothetical protein
VCLVIVGGVSALLAAWLGLVIAYARPLRAFWCEPVFKRPVLIFESDDWGPAPPDHAEMLAAIAALLREFSDQWGHHPVMTLAVVLAVPEPGGAAAAEPRELTFADARYGPLREAIRAGVDAGVFQLQLHGRSHYWLPALVDASKADPGVARWLDGPDTWHTEALPAELQSRWEPRIGRTPFPISDETARVAAERDARLFKDCFGASAAIAVPTRFDWYPALERGWAAAGVGTVVTPGRYDWPDGRDVGRMTIKRITNGMRSEHVRYVVRDQYFEPYKGHDAEHGLRALATNTALGRPTLLEIHRVNFLGADMRQRSLLVMRELLERALVAYAELRFLSTVELVDAMEAKSQDLIDRSLRRRVAAWCARTRTIHRLWKLARLSGLSLVVIALERLVSDRG